MKINTALRFRPFSRRSETECFIPKTALRCRVFPKRVEIWDGSGDHNICVAAISFSFAGIFYGQMTMVDLEGGTVVVSGRTGTGLFRYEITGLGHGFSLQVVKAPEDLMVDVIETQYHIEEKGSVFLFHEGDAREANIDGLVMPHRERLSLGCSKAQDVELMLRRQDLREIIPVLYFYAQSVAVSSSLSATCAWKEPACQPSCCPLALQNALQDLIAAGFKDLFVPVISDLLFRGYKNPFFPDDSLKALAACYPHLRQLFFKEHDNVWFFLPSLLPQFYAGRMTDVRSLKGHHIAFEWTKKQMRQVCIIPRSDDTVTVRFPSEIKAFRVSTENPSRKTKMACTKEGVSFPLQAGIPLLLDNFEK